MYKSKRKRLGLPPRWLNCPRMGNVVNDIFIPFKTPLDEKFDSELAPAYRFSLETLLSSEKTKKMGLIISLTKTERYYKSEDLKGHKQYVKIPCEGHDGPPTVEQVHNFIDICANYQSINEDLCIGVHCTHGFNRTGFMIVSYLCEKCDVELEIAAHLFAVARPPGIYKQDYLDELMLRYDCDEAILIAPERPDWSSGEDGDESNIPEPLEALSDSTSASDAESIKSGDMMKSKLLRPKRKGVNRYVPPKDAVFMDGVSGVSVEKDIAMIEEVQQRVRDLMHSTKYNFIGSQPVSMTLENLRLLTEKKYMVSWKADGTRYLMLIASRDLIYMFDRDNCVFKVKSLNFPIDDVDHHSNTLVDGEMVIDKWKGLSYPRFLIYDVMVVNGEYVGDQVFSTRFQMIKKHIIDPRGRFVTPEMKKHESFGIRIKDFWPIDKTQEIWEGKFRSELCHEMDGLIFQPTGPTDVYLPGRCDSILKWKPPNLNSIDFKMICSFVKEPNLLPRFVGFLYVSGLSDPFGTIENIKKDMREKYNNKIVECTLNTKTLQWIILRERTDKSVPNHISTAQGVLESINHPVHIEHVYSAIAYVKQRGNL